MVPVESGALQADSRRTRGTPTSFLATLEVTVGGLAASTGARERRPPASVCALRVGSVVRGSVIKELVG
ncbi:MAG: hypothetical protein AB7O52_11030 [Planctomycetota bacterium]